MKPDVFCHVRECLGIDKGEISIVKGTEKLKKVCVCPLLYFVMIIGVSKRIPTTKILSTAGEMPLDAT